MRYPLALAMVGAIVVAAEARPLDTAAWLVDLGRDYPRTQQAGLTDADGQIALLLMQAASRVNPAAPEPCFWQYDMLAALGQRDAAREALGRLIDREPADLVEHLRWIAMQTDTLQTADKRAEFWRAQLRKPNLPPAVASDLHARLAGFHRNRGETQLAINEARTAIQAYGLNFRARRLLQDLRSGKEPPRVRDSARLEETLLALAAGPGQAGLAWQAADQLMALNLPEPADRLYKHAVAILQIFDPQGDLPAAMTARIISLRALGQQNEANELSKQTSTAWMNLLAANEGTLDPERTAEMAWFFTYFDPKPADAETLARTAAREVPELATARRALGAALRLQGKLDDAKAELSRVADTDAAAAAEYAQVLSAANDEPKARQVIVAASSRPADPMGEAVLAQVRRKLGVAPPASAPAPAEARQALARFSWAVLDYPLRPDKSLSLTIEPPGRQVTAAEPWRVTARLRNIGPFPITLGEDLMVVPDMLISVDTTGDRPRGTGPNITLSFSKTAVLAPGESVEASTTVLLGAVRSGMIGTPQMVQNATVSAVLSPIRTVGDRGQTVWSPGVGGLLAEPAKFRRAAFVPDDRNMADLQAKLQSADPMQRIPAMELLTMLLAEPQHIRAGRLLYTAKPIDERAVQGAILSRVADPDWQVRARLAECLRWIELDKEATNAALTLLRDSEWLVRGLTMRALADHYGAKFQSVLTQAAQVDPDDWVRRFTAALNERITIATSQPASQPEAEH